MTPYASDEISKTNPHKVILWFQQNVILYSRRQTSVATVTVNRIKGPTLYNDIPLTIKDYILLKPQYNLMWICF
jgi:hypothetical protein